jgi:tRNA-binding protein
LGALSVRRRFLQRESRPTSCTLISAGEIGMEKLSTQITHLYQPDELEGKLIVAVVNFPPKQGPVMSECLVTGLPTISGEVALCVPDKPVSLGTKML